MRYTVQTLSSGQQTIATSEPLTLDDALYRVADITGRSIDTVIATAAEIDGFPWLVPHIRGAMRGFALVRGAGAQ